MVAEGIPSGNREWFAASFQVADLVRQKQAVSTNSSDTFADGLACRIPDPDALTALLNEKHQMAGKKLAVIASGANIDRALYLEILGGED